MRTFRFSLCQCNFKVGDIQGNTDKIKLLIQKALKDKADAAVFPELSITGYPPEDLVFKTQFIGSNLEALKSIIDFSKGKKILIIIGFIHKNDEDNNIFNSAGIIYNGKLIDIYHKIFLPNYGVFDEKRYFTPGNSVPVLIYKGIRIGVNICEDIWYPVGPLHYQSVAGNAEVIINISASPYHTGKQSYREKMFGTRAGDESVILLNCNLVGGQDELVFDGCSTAYNENGGLIARMRSFEEDFMSFDIDADTVFRKRLKDIRRRQEKEYLKSPFEVKIIEVDKMNISPARALSKKAIIHDETGDIASIYKALVLGTHDYVEKNGFENVIVAVSGGIDSALVAAIAVDALGPDRVKGIFLPSEFSASISREDAGILARNLGIEFLELSIQDLYESYNLKFKKIFKGLPFGIAEENLQSRIRGNIVMALSNKFGWLVLTTGNKSEMSAGYATLYGDMAGGFAVIKDVLKTTVYELAEYRNAIKPVIPSRIIERAPSAELRANQKDSDSLPEYPILDAVIRAYVEEDSPVEEIAAEIGDAALVKRVISMIDKSEYKRRQSPPGIKISPRAFGRDRRMPVTNGYKA